MNGRTDRHTNVQRETIIPRHYRVAGYKNAKVSVQSSYEDMSGVQVYYRGLELWRPVGTSPTLCIRRIIIITPTTTSNNNDNNNNYLM